MNKMQFIGRVGQDIELKKTENGTSLVDFSLASTEKYKGQERTTWIQCTAWSGIAETIAKFVHKGDLIYVEGKFRNDKYQDKDGQTKYKAYMLVAGFEFLPNQKRGETVNEDPGEAKDPESETFESFGWF